MNRFIQGQTSKAAFLALFFTFTASLAKAKAADLSSLLELSLDDLIAVPIITASRQVETRHDTPAHVTVVTRKQIQARR